MTKKIAHKFSQPVVDENGEDPMVAAGRRFRDWAEERYMAVRGWRSKFAADLGVSPTTISQIMSGDRKISGNVRDALRALGADVEYIVVGKHVTPVFSHEEHVHYCGTPTTDLKSRIESLVKEALQAEERLDDAYLASLACAHLTRRGTIDADSKEGPVDSKK